MLSHRRMRPGHNKTYSAFTLWPVQIYLCMCTGSSKNPCSLMGLICVVQYIYIYIQFSTMFSTQTNISVFRCCKLITFSLNMAYIIHACDNNIVPWSPVSSKETVMEWASEWRHRTTESPFYQFCNMFNMAWIRRLGVREIFCFKNFDTFRWTVVRVFKLSAVNISNVNFTSKMTTNRFNMLTATMIIPVLWVHLVANLHT